jgi:hypothetical protein
MTEGRGTGLASGTSLGGEDRQAWHESAATVHPSQRADIAKSSDCLCHLIEQQPHTVKNMTTVAQVTVHAIWHACCPDPLVHKQNYWD